MASDEKIIQMGEPQETPQAITITIMDPSALGDASINSSLVASVEAQNDGSDPSTIVMVPGEEHSSKDILQTVTETHMGTEELPIISSISNPEEEGLAPESKVSDTFEGEGAEGEGDELVGQHCLICNLDLPPCGTNDQIPVFKTQTSTTHRRLAVFLSNLIGQKLTSRKAHSDIMCQRCFNLLDRVDSLEVEIKETKEEIVNKYQETVSIYGGRARRRKPATAKKTDYVFPKVEPEDETDQLMGMEIDGNFEPRMEDLMEEEHDRQEDRNAQDEEWEPEFKRPRIKREATDIDSGVPPKRKRGRPRKDATRPKELDGGEYIAGTQGIIDEPSGEGRLSCSGMMKTKTCVYCEQEVPIVQLISHMDGHEHQQYSCPLCKHASSRHSLSRHLQEEHSKNIMTCKVCSLKFFDSEAFNSHQLSHTSGGYLCEICNAKFGTANELSNHRNIQHLSKEVDKFACPICNKEYGVRSKLVTHIIKLHKGKVHVDGLVWGSRGSLVCSFCQKRFKKASSYLAHEKTHRSKKYYCPHCQGTYSSYSFLQDHILTHQFGDYECNECSVKFASLHQLSIHEEKVHKSKPSKICEYCQKEFREQKSLICHRRKEHPESEESRKAKYCCSECGMKFMVRGNFVRHLRVHDKERIAKPCTCDLCGKVLANKYSLASHMKTHSSDTSYKCNVCDKAFVTKYTLVDHVRRLHEYCGSGRDKVCEQCGRSFFTNSELKYHLKTHTGERPYRCDTCGETYLSSSTLRYHMQKHSNIMFVCPDCQAKFENYVGWSAHMKRVHGVSRVKDYTRQHGILQAVMNKETPSLYIFAEGRGSVIDSSQNIVASDDSKKENESSATLAVGLEETVVSVPGKEVTNIIQVVSYDDMTNPLVHTVDATKVGLSHPRIGSGEVSHSNISSTTALGTNSINSVAEPDYKVTEEWGMILPHENEEAPVMSEEWEGSRITVAEGGGQQMVLTSEWDGAPGMAHLIVSEDTEEARVGMSSWKSCVDY